MNCQYLPYLRGKQAELIAIKEFAQQTQNLVQFVLPIIEPVKRESSTLDTTAKVLQEKNMKFAIVLNPFDGDFRVGDVNFFEGLSESLRESVGTTWIPAFLYRGVSLDQIKSQLKPHSMLIFQRNVSSADVMGLVEDDRIDWIVDGTGQNRSFPQEILNERKILYLGDYFQNQPRNADYAERPDEFFTEPLQCLDASNCQCFADYTVLPSAFQDGGMLPYAVAIHLTYCENTEVRVHHFVSDNNQDQSNIQGKFQEAVKKIDDFYENRSLEKTYGVANLLEKYRNQHYPGLGVLKRWSIENHLELMARFLKKNNRGKSN